MVLVEEKMERENDNGVECVYKESNDSEKEELRDLPQEISAAIADHFESEKALQTALEKVDSADLAAILLDGKPLLSHAVR
jgi:hemerythrin